ncbi:Cof-type HAD-IIB family hydrolase [Chloroflexota bacterium]
MKRIELIKSAYKLLVMDVDGTLLGQDGAVSAEDREALARVAAMGIKISLSTGRTLLSSRSIIDQLSLDGYHILFDGALIVDPVRNEEVLAQTISKELVREAVKFAHQKDINLELFSATRYFIERESWASDIRRNYFNIQPTLVDFTDIWERERIIKGTIAVHNPEEKAQAEMFSRQFKDSLSDLRFSWTATPAYPKVDFINIVALGVSKGTALKALTSHLKIPLSAVMAIGDERNDIPLLTEAGLAVAMENALDEVKAVADYVTLDVDHSGVAAAVNKFLL